MAKQTGDLASEDSDGRLCVVYEDGNTNGAASVSVDTSYDDGVETSYCENFPYDVLDDVDVDADHCEEHGLHFIELDGSNLTITLNANVDVNTVNGIDHDDRREEDFNFTLTIDGTSGVNVATLVLDTDTLPSGYDPDNITMENIIEHAFISDEDGHHIGLYIKNLSLDKYDSEIEVLSGGVDYTGGEVDDLNPFWRYDCGDDQGGTGRLITVPSMMKTLRLKQLKRRLKRIQLQIV